MYHVVLFCLKLMSRAPFWLLYAISDLLFYPLYYIIRYRRKVVRRNLVESFPEKSLAEVKRIEKGFYHFFVDVLLESIKMFTISFEDIKRRAVIKNPEMVNALLEKGQPVSVFIGHYGNWEWLTTARLWLHDETEMIQIYHKMSSPAMERIILFLRERFGNKCVPRNETVRYLVNAQKEGRKVCVGFIADQSPKRRESKYFLRFLNHTAPVLTGTEKLVKHFGHAAFFLNTRRIKRGYYEYEFVPMHEDSRQLPDFELTRLYFERLEEMIKCDPQLYLWTHNRFKYAKHSDNVE